MKEAAERKNSIDFLKVCATVLIVFHHYEQEFGGRFYGDKFYFGYLVELFFLISGYFTFRYIQKIEDGLEFKRFYLHKAFRLLPLVGIAAFVFEVILYFLCQCI